VSVHRQIFNQKDDKPYHHEKKTLLASHTTKNDTKKRTNAIISISPAGDVYRRGGGSASPLVGRAPQSPLDGADFFATRFGFSENRPRRGRATRPTTTGTSNSCHDDDGRLIFIFRYCRGQNLKIKNATTRKKKLLFLFLSAFIPPIF